jgi:signal transduction histidine kinase
VVHGTPPVRVTVRQLGDRAQLAVTDAGSGIAPADVEAAFGRFWRGGATRSPHGTGLGLAIVRATARAHGGDVEVHGATFTLDLPAGAPGSPIVREASEKPPTVPEVHPPR